MRLPLWKAQQCQGNKPRTSNVLLRVNNIVKAAFIMYPTGGGAEDFRGGSQIFRAKKGGI